MSAAIAVPIPVAVTVVVAVMVVVLRLSVAVPVVRSSEWPPNESQPPMNGRLKPNTMANVAAMRFMFDSCVRRIRRRSIE